MEAVQSALRGDGPVIGQTAGNRRYGAQQPPGGRSGTEPARAIGETPGSSGPRFATSTRNSLGIPETAFRRRADKPVGGEMDIVPGFNAEAASARNQLANIRAAKEYQAGRGPLTRGAADVLGIGQQGQMGAGASIGAAQQGGYTGPGGSWQTPEQQQRNRRMAIGSQLDELRRGLYNQAMRQPPGRARREAMRQAANAYSSAAGDITGLEQSRMDREGALMEQTIGEMGETARAREQRMADEAAFARDYQIEEMRRQQDYVRGLMSEDEQRRYEAQQKREDRRWQEQSPSARRSQAERLYDPETGVLAGATPAARQVVENLLKQGVNAPRWAPYIAEIIGSEGGEKMSAADIEAALQKIQGFPAA